MANYQALLLGAQAAGIGLNLYAARNAAGQSGIEVDRAQMQVRAEQEQLAFQEANIASLESFAETLSTQRAILAARGYCWWYWKCKGF